MRSRWMPRTGNRAKTLGILVAALLLAQLPLFPLLVFTGVGNWSYLCSFLCCGVMAILPFVLMKLAPEAAGFDRQWLPRGWLQWLGILPLVLLAFVVGGLAVMLTRHLHLGLHRPYYIPTITGFSRPTIVANGLLIILLAPIAEEIFYRGYVLDQLTKLLGACTKSERGQPTGVRPRRAPAQPRRSVFMQRSIMHWALALPLHAAIFALVHFGFSFTFLQPLGAFFFGLVLGAWRIRFKSLLPLIVAHVLINAAATVPNLRRDYETLRMLEDFQATGIVPADFSADVVSNPRCQQIAALTRQPAAEALPKLIDLLDDDDDIAVHCCAVWAIGKYSREDARPYLKEALASAKPDVVSGALFVLSMRPDSALREEVRQVAWSAHDPKLQIVATVTLHDMEDTEGLRKIAEGHPDMKTRQSAKRWLQR